MAHLVVDGLLIRRVHVGAEPTAELLGPGDLLAPVDRSSHLATAYEYEVLLRARIAAVDLAAPPSDRLLGAALDQVRRATELIAIGHLPRVEDRVLGLMWHLLDRWGRVGVDGWIVPLKLTHAVIGSLVGARRPTVTIALRRRDEDGLLSRRAGDGFWTVDPESAPAGGAMLAPR